MFKYRLTSLTSQSLNILLSYSHVARVQMEFHRAEQGVHLFILSDTGRHIQVLFSLLHAHLLLLHLVHAADGGAGHEDWATGPEALSHPWDVEEVLGTTTRPNVEHTQAEQLVATEDVSGHTLRVWEGYHALTSLVFVEFAAAVDISLVVAQLLRHVVHLKNFCNLVFELMNNFSAVAPLQEILVSDFVVRHFSF